MKFEQIENSRAAKINDRITYLIRTHFLGDITPEEQDELNGWLEESEINRNAFNVIANDTEAMQDTLGFLKTTDELAELKEQTEINGDALAEAPLDEELKKLRDFVKQTNVEKPLQKIRQKLRFNQGFPVPQIVPESELVTVEKVSNPVRSMYGGWLSAACIIFLLGVGFSLYTIPDDPVTRDMPPGKTIATLEFSDSKVLLNQKTKDGLISLNHDYTIKKENNQIIYTAAPLGSYSQNARIPHVISTPRGGTQPLVLSDGSKIWLNPSSSVKFPPVFTGHERMVTISGEAYFEIATIYENGKKKPFIVEIEDKMRIEVLGTHFNVNAYPDEPSIKTTLVEGSVKVITPEATTLLKPGQQAEVSNDRKIHVNDVGELGAAATKAWKEGHINFRKADMKAILREIGRWYDMDIEYEADIPVRHFAGEVSRDTKLSEVIAALKKNKISCKIKGKKIVVAPMTNAGP